MEENYNIKTIDMHCIEYEDDSLIARIGVFDIRVDEPAVTGYKFIDKNGQPITFSNEKKLEIYKRVKNKLNILDFDFENNINI